MPAGEAHGNDAEKEQYAEMDEEDGIRFSCPYCEETVLFLSEDGCQIVPTFCEHVVFAATWGTDLWSGSDTVVQTGSAEADAKVWECIQEGGSCSPYELDDDVCDVLSAFFIEKEGFDISSTCKHLECGMGPHGGGPTYVLVFMGRRQST